ncbi:MAG TPA: sulfotransferase [Actinomycetota bacterium]|nr:sulfotransferase [Actinomycetota bacterium]
MAEASLAFPSAPPHRGPGEPVRYVCMPGSPYTGSTLLGLLLDHHPGFASVGAATGLTPRIDPRTYRCSCGARFVECEFWRRVARRTAELGHPVAVFGPGWSTDVRVSRRRWLNGILVRSLGSLRVNAARDAVLWRSRPIRRRLAGASLATWSLATAVLEATGKEVFVDTARDHQRPKYLRGTPLLDLRVIHLVRDPRGNVASIMRHTGADVATASRRWRHANLEADRLRRLLPPQAWLRLRYEDLCADPGGTLERIARFAGVEPAPLPGAIGGPGHHLIGNSMRLRGVSEIREDRRWREELGARELRTIARIAGRASHRLGYDWP